MISSSKRDDRRLNASWNFVPDMSHSPNASTASTAHADFSACNFVTVLISLFPFSDIHLTRVDCHRAQSSEMVPHVLEIFPAAYALMTRVKWHVGTSFCLLALTTTSIWSPAFAIKNIANSSSSSFSAALFWHSSLLHDTSILLTIKNSAWYL